MAARPAGAAFPWSSYRINFRRLGRQAVYVAREPETACEELRRRFQRGLGKHLAVAAELIDYYRRRGYLPTGEERPFPMGDERFDLPKTSDLTIVVLARNITTG